MKWNRRENPKENGDYLIRFSGGTPALISFTRNGGWNTFYDYKGHLNRNNALGHNMVDARIKGWMPVPEWED